MAIIAEQSRDGPERVEEAERMLEVRIKHWCLDEIDRIRETLRQREFPPSVLDEQAEEIWALRRRAGIDVTKSG